MPESQRKKFTLKDGISIGSFVITVIAFSLMMRGQAINHTEEMVLLKDQVSRNTDDLETNNLELINYKLEQLDVKMDRIIILLDD